MASSTELLSAEPDDFLHIADVSDTVEGGNKIGKLKTITVENLLGSPTKIPRIELDTAYTPNGEPVGSIYWNQDEETIDVVLSTGVRLQVGQEVLFNVKNQTGAPISKGTPLMFAGTLGSSGRILVQKAIADGSIDSSYTLGLASEDIANGENGKATWFGKIRGIDTDGLPYGETWVDGDIIYISPTTAGDLTKVRPNVPNRTIQVAAVIDSDSDGTLIVRPTWYPKLVDLDDVNGTALTANGQIMVWDNDNQYFDFTHNINTVSGGVEVNVTSVTAYTIIHNLNYYPTIICLDSAGIEVYIDITHNSKNSFTINAKPAYTGIVTYK